MKLVVLNTFRLFLLVQPSSSAAAKKVFVAYYCSADVVLGRLLGTPSHAPVQLSLIFLVNIITNVKKVEWRAKLNFESKLRKIIGQNKNSKIRRKNWSTSGMGYNLPQHFSSLLTGARLHVVPARLQLLLKRGKPASMPTLAQHNSLRQCPSKHGMPLVQRHWPLRRS